MSGNGTGNGKNQKPSPDSEHIASAIREVTNRIGHTISIRKESTSEDNDQYAEEKASRESQSSSAKKLNNITIASSVIAFFALIAVYLQYRQSREVFKAGQRAWVIVIKTPIIPSDQHPASLNEVISTPIQSGVSFSIPVIFKNTGLSPAIRVHMSQEIPQINGSDCAKFSRPSPYKSFIVVAPGEIATNPNVGGNFTAQCVSALEAGTASFTLKGTIFYDDIFHDPHETHYCIRYEGTTTRSMSACEDGNDAD